MISQLPLSERPREKMLIHGSEALTNAELMAIVFRTGTKNRSALELGHDIVKYCNNDITTLQHCTLEELTTIQGIGESKACLLMAICEITKRIQSRRLERKYKINSPHAVVDFFTSELSHLSVEKFIAVLLNTKNEMISWEVISIGSLNASIVHPREVFNKAIKKSAAAIIVLHNHPSGHVNPSSEDIAVTKRLQEAGKIIGIPLLDHIIIGKNTHYSFKEEDQL